MSQTAIEKTLSENVGLLWNLKGWNQKQTRGRTVDRVRSGMANPELDTLEYVAAKARIPVWYLFLPRIDKGAIANTDLDKAVTAYLQLDTAKRKSALDLLNALGQLKHA